MMNLNWLVCARWSFEWCICRSWWVAVWQRWVEAKEAIFDDAKRCFSEPQLTVELTHLALPSFFLFWGACQEWNDFSDHPRRTVCADGYLREVKAAATCQTFDTFQSDKLPLPCQSLIRRPGFYLLLIHRQECPAWTWFSHKKLLKRSIEGYCTSMVQKVRDTLIDCQRYDEFVVLFHQLPAVSILWCRLPCRQYAWNPSVPPSSWHVKILSYVDAFAIDRRLSSALPPLLVKGLSFRYTGAPHSFYSPKCTKNWICT